MSLAGLTASCAAAVMSESVASVSGLPSAAFMAACASTGVPCIAPMAILTSCQWPDTKRLPATASDSTAKSL